MAFVKVHVSLSPLFKSRTAQFEKSAYYVMMMFENRGFDAVELCFI